MLLAWKLNGQAQFKKAGEGLFLVEIQHQKDVLRVLDGAPWNFRSDLVAVRQVISPLDVHEGAITHFDTWVQMHSVSPELLAPKTILQLASSVGQPLATLFISAYGGRRYLRARVRLEISKLLIDKAELLLLGMGKVEVHFVYERMNRICTFCGIIGHKVTSCKLWLRITRLTTDLRFVDQISMEDTKPNKLGAWMMASSHLLDIQTPSDTHVPTPTQMGQYPPQDNSQVLHGQQTPLHTAGSRPITNHTTTLPTQTGPAPTCMVII